MTLTILGSIPGTHFTGLGRIGGGFWLTIGFLGLLALGSPAIADWIINPALAANPGVLAAPNPVFPPPEGRLIDRSTIEQERSTTMKRFGPVSIVVATLLVVATLGGLLALLYNGLVSAREQVNAGWAQVENVYQRRLDLIPLLVDAVRTYTEHERETLEALTRARADALQQRIALGAEPRTAGDIQAVEAAQGRVAAALTRLMAVVENYPDLKSSSNFLTLQDQIEGTENRVAMERRNYNEVARRYNTRLQSFPSNLVGSMMGFAPKPYFEAKADALQGVSDPFGRHPG